MQGRPDLRLDRKNLEATKRMVEEEARAARREEEVLHATSTILVSIIPSYHTITYTWYMETFHRWKIGHFLLTAVPNTPFV